MSVASATQRLAPAAMPALMDALYARLVVVADKGEPCPSGEVLGDAIGVAAEKIGWLLRRLAAAGRIDVAHEDLAAGSGQVYRYRIVTIRATGARTAKRRRPPETMGEALTPEAARLERAKTYLRQRGAIVYAASVTACAAAGDLVVVDHRLLSPVQVLARATALGCAGI